MGSAYMGKGYLIIITTIIVFSCKAHKLDASLASHDVVRKSRHFGKYDWRPLIIIIIIIIIT